MDESRIQELKDMLKVDDRWYHKTPYVGKKILNKQKVKKYKDNKPKIYSTIIEEAEKLARENNKDFFEQFVNINDIPIRNSFEYAIVDK